MDWPRTGSPGRRALLRGGRCGANKLAWAGPKDALARGRAPLGFKVPPFPLGGHLLFFLRQQAERAGPTQSEAVGRCTLW